MLLEWLDLFGIVHDRRLRVLLTRELHEKITGKFVDIRCMSVTYAEFEYDFSHYKLYPTAVAVSRLQWTLSRGVFLGGDITFDNGVVLLKKADRGLRLTELGTKWLTDLRRLAGCHADAMSIGCQRALGLARECEDLNDQKELRRDLVL